MDKAKREFLTGVIIGLFITLLLTVKAIAAPVGQTIDELEIYPCKAQINEAEDYLAENQIRIPKEVEEACIYYGKRYDICPEVLEAVCWVESSCKKTAQSPDKECKGLMQIKPSSHTDRMNRLNARNVFSTWDNIETGTDYLHELLDGGDEIAVALAIYNGQSAEKIKKTRKGEYTGYVKKVLDISQALERVHFK